MLKNITIDPTPTSTSTSTSTSTYLRTPPKLDHFIDKYTAKMGCFGKRSNKLKRNHNNPAYNFPNSPPARPVNPNPTPQYSYNQNQVMPQPVSIARKPAYSPPSSNWHPADEPLQGLPNFRPDGAIPDGKGTLPGYMHASMRWASRPPLAPPPSSSIQLRKYSGYDSSQAGNRGFKPPPAAFTPAAPGGDDDLPPPPAISHEISPASNTTAALADAGYDFCVMNPLSPPQQFPQSALSQISSTTQLSLAPPPECFRGSITTYDRTIIETSNKGGCPDTCLISALPLFCAGYHHPANTGKSRHIYFEILLERLSEDATVAIGFVGHPYPGFRLPGWNRGSFGVHSDDGRRYCNDSYGGKDFTEKFRAGERVGIGMKFPVASSGHGVEIFFNRNGAPAGGWRLDEETDAELDWPATEGLDGSADVYAAIGVWGSGIRVRVDNFYSREE